MAAQPPGLNVWRKLTSWLWRHKVLAVFATALATGFLFLVGSWLVLQVQIHFERERFAQVEAVLKALGGSYERADRRYVTRKLLKGCAYTSVSIGTGSRSCSVDQYVVYELDNVEQARSLMARLNEAMMTEYHLGLNALSTQNETSLGSYDFRIAGQSCSVDYWYFSNGTLPYATEEFSLDVDHGLFVDVGCEGKAKAEFFSIKQN